jgi:hypothetical protein
LAPRSAIIEKRAGEMPMITIDNIDYNTEDLSGNGLIQLANLQFLEGQIQKIRQEMAIY